jgi:hypothetical protein
MRFESGIENKRRDSIEKACATIVDVGDDFHRHMMNEFFESKMLIKVEPVAKINASGVIGVINVVKTNIRMMRERLSLRDALAEIYISIAAETIGDGFQRGVEGTFVHEGRHAYDFALTLESLSNADVNPIGVFDPSLYDMEWEAHLNAGRWMLRVNKPDYLDEGLQLMILGQSADGSCFLNEDGIKQRLRDSYGLAADGNVGSLASEMMGLRI